MTLDQAKDWMAQNRIGLDDAAWQARHPDWRKTTDIVRTFNLIKPDWRGGMENAA